MIQELKIQNFLSFKDEVVFSFEATADKTLEDYFVYEPVPGVRLLKLAMVYGANASGKSNLLKAFDFISDIVFNMVENQEEELDYFPFEFDETRKQPGKFELTFYINSSKYIYFLELDNDKIYKEKLSFYPGTQPAILFNRFFNEDLNISVVEFGPKIKISGAAKEEINLKTLRNCSVFAARSQVNISIPEIDKVYMWFKNQFMNSINPYTQLTNYSDNHIKEDPVIKEFALRLIKEADFNVSDFLFDDDIIEDVPDEILSRLDSLPISEKEKDQIRKEKKIHVERMSFEHQIVKDGKVEKYSLPEERQSRGTMRYYGLTAPFYNMVKNNAFLPIDEIGSALHPLLVMHFLREFLKYDESSSQLLFTTHNMSLLNEKDILRKDAIWITAKNEDGATDLYSIDDIKDFRKELSYYNYYKQGKFGGIPELD